jgi:hypothetical protein
MALKLVIDLDQSAEDLLAGYGAGAVISIERDTSSAMTGATEIATVPIVDGTQQYEHWDAAGDGSHYYRTAVRAAGGTPASEYGPVFRGTAQGAYATIQDVVDTMDLPSQAKYSLLQRLLDDTSEEVDRVCGRTFRRVPDVDGEETFFVDVLDTMQRSLAAANCGQGCSDGHPLDIISISAIDYRADETDDYQALTENTDFILQRGAGPPGMAWPYEDLQLIYGAKLAYWPPGLRAVRITGVRGFTAVPGEVRRAVVDSVRDQHRQAVLGAPQAAGVNQFGVPVVMTGQPRSWREALRDAIGAPYVKRWNKL